MLASCRRNLEKASHVRKSGEHDTHLIQREQCTEDEKRSAAGEAAKRAAVLVQQRRVPRAGWEACVVRTRRRQTEPPTTHTPRRQTRPRRQSRTWGREGSEAEHKHKGVP